jgi:hypothetical protein
VRVGAPHEPGPGVDPVDVVPDAAALAAAADNAV